MLKYSLANKIFFDQLLEEILDEPPAVMSGTLSILSRVVHHVAGRLLPTARRQLPQLQQPGWWLTSQSAPPAACITRGMQYRNNPKRRCKYCYVVYEDERKFVFCDKHPRHKAGQLMPIKWQKRSMIMTHATQGGKGRMPMWTQQGMREDY